MAPMESKSATSVSMEMAMTNELREMNIQDQSVSSTSALPVSSDDNSMQSFADRAKSCSVNRSGALGGASSAGGYAENAFEGKNSQMEEVVRLVTEKGFIPANLVEAEVAWFYNNLGIDNMYFCVESAEVIAHHIMALYAAKMSAYLRSADSLEINLEQETEDGAVFIHSSKPGISVVTGPQYEQRIDEKYLDVSTSHHAFRLESYRSTGMVGTDFSTQLRCYFITKTNFIVSDPTEEEMLDIERVSDSTFLSKASANTLEIYSRIMAAVLERTGPVIEMHETHVGGKDSRIKRLIIGYRQQSTQKFFSAISDLYHYYDLYSTVKYVENFSNGVTIMCVYLAPLDNSTAPSIEHSILQIMREASLIYCLPQTSLQSLFKSGILSVQETIYGYAGLIFAQHFLNRLGPEYSSLVSILDAGNVQHLGVLDRIKKRLRQETFTREYILDIVRQYPDLVRILFVNFAMKHYMPMRRDEQGNQSLHASSASNISIISNASYSSTSSSTSSGRGGSIIVSDVSGASPFSSNLRPTLSYQRLQKDKALTDAEILDRIRKTVSNTHEQLVFESFLTFNSHILKTNFYQPTKVALSFRLDPAFLPQLEYPIAPFGMFLVLGSEFRGFHIRFRDIARGGIRIIRSRNREAYSINVRTLFDENYALASTQQRKNKDIPEGGSKGTILLDVAQQGSAAVAFQKYVDSILDLIVPGTTPGIKDRIVDLYGKPEILFFGPDEGTAEYMDWASQHARQRGAHFWKGFTTGKSQSLGGIPHDVFGMTTHSIHQYVLGIYEKLGIAEETCRKMQTGGPDGDLGSNEIRISKDLTTAIVDGSGVVCDPEGLDRNELMILARNRRMISNFDTTKLGPKGYCVLIDEHDKILPDGTVVEDGLAFRNEYHLNHADADLFVPCGGRPEAVDINTVHRLFDVETGKPKIKWIVEGANLFFTQDARLKLEEAGVIIFKDASANKGGVTSSSMEVLAALALTDEEFAECMQVSSDGVMPAFYSAYVSEVHNIIERNARMEFECLWHEYCKGASAEVVSSTTTTTNNQQQQHSHSNSNSLRLSTQISPTNSSSNGSASPDANSTAALGPFRPLSVLSDELSMAITKLDDELQAASMLWDNVALRRLVLSDAIPKLLVDRVGGIDTLMNRLPESYVRAVFGSALASRFVYEHGIVPSQFAFFEFMTEYYTRLSQTPCSSSS